MRETTTTRGFPVFGIAVGGLVLGHLMTYALLYPDPDHRGLVLSSSGHAYLPALAHVACVVAAAALATIVARSWGGGDRSVRSFAGLAAALVIVQASAFVGQEILERVVSGSSLHELFAGPLLAIGVSAQGVLALIGASIATWLRRTTERLAAAGPAARTRMWRPRALLPVVAVDRGPRTPFVVGVRPGRSPPSA